jgi:hypothetical protein
VKGIVEPALLYLRAERVQQYYLLPAALLMACAGPVIAVIWPCPSGDASSWVFVLNLMLMQTLGMEILFAGVSFRAAAAFRALTLIPYSRLRLALAALLAVVLAASLVTASAAITHHAAPCIDVPWGGLSGTFGGTLALGCLVIMTSFLASGGAMWSRLGWVALLLLGGLLLAVRGGHVAKQLGLTPVGGIELIAAAGAIAFAVWYSRARVISPPQSNQNTSSLSLGIADIRPSESIGKSREESADICLMGRTSVLRACWPWLLLFACNNLLYVYFFGIWSYGVHRPNPDWSIVFPLTLTLIVSFGAFFPTLVLRRSRALWLLGGLSRLELFERVEKISLSSFAWSAGPALAMWALAWLANPGAWGLYLLALSVSTSLCSVYLTLLDVRRNSQFNPYTTALVVLTWALFMPHEMLHLLAPGDPRALLLPAAEIAATPALRAIALRRWQHIDWLICKPPPSNSQRLRAVG